MIYTNELTVNVGGYERKVFLQNGFYNNSAPTQYMHKHNYSEIHFAIGGKIVIAVDDKAYELTEGDFIVIPSGIYHGCRTMETNAKHCAFQADIALLEIAVQSVNSGIAVEFMDEIARCGKNGDHSRILAFIALVCSFFISNVEARGVTDNGFLISEFFSNNYGADIRLEQLAELLHLSPRQAERVVVAYTGRTFREELTATRMNVADRLINISDMPLSQVAQYVGYRSYAGFWKAYQKHKNALLKTGKRAENKS